MRVGFFMKKDNFDEMSIYLVHYKHRDEQKQIKQKISKLDKRLWNCGILFTGNMAQMGEH